MPKYLQAALLTLLGLLMLIVPAVIHKYAPSFNFNFKATFILLTLFFVIFRSIRSIRYAIRIGRLSKDFPWLSYAKFMENVKEYIAETIAMLSVACDIGPLYLIGMAIAYMLLYVMGFQRQYEGFFVIGGVFSFLVWWYMESLNIGNDDPFAFYELENVKRMEKL